MHHTSYMLTTEHSEEEVEDMYEKIVQLVGDATKGKHYTIVMTDFRPRYSSSKTSVTLKTSYDPSRSLEMSPFDRAHTTSY